VKKTNKKFRSNLNVGWRWLALALFANMLFLPSGIFLKLLTDDITPTLLPIIRYGVLSLILLPMVVQGVKKHRRVLKKNWVIIALVSVVSAVDPIFNAIAMSMSGPSFLAVLEMFSPIVFTILSVMIIKDKITKNSLIGLLFAILGGAIIFVLPMLIGSGSVVVYGWTPVILFAVVVAVAPLWPVYLRKQHENGLPVVLVAGIGFLFATLIALVFAIASFGIETLAEIGDLTPAHWFMLIYLGVVVSLCAQTLRVKAYEHIGTITHAALSYLHYALMVLVPMLVLGERLSWEMFIGAGFILVGVVFSRMRAPSIRTGRRR